MDRKTDILIIGGGVIGMACAYELSLKGAKVTVIDKGRMGHGCSYGNAGWVTPCFALPLPRPGMFFKSVKWLLNPEGPLYIKPRSSVALFRWLFRFLLSMNNKHLHRSAAALVELSKYSLNRYAEIAKDSAAELDFRQKGLLMVAQGQEGFDAAVDELELMARLGISGKKLDADAMRALEPAITGKIVGGVFFDKEASLEPLMAVEEMRKISEKNGVVFSPLTEVFAVHSNDGKITRVRTTRGDFVSEQVVLASGIWSHDLGDMLGLNVPVLGGKGYALTVKPFSPGPETPMMLVEKKIAVTPRRGSVRLAGTMELVDNDDSITERRVNAIVRGAREFMNVPDAPEVIEIWRGLRPCTPDGVPMIGRSKKFSNLVVATGHQMLGLQSAPGTGRLVADLMMGATPSFDLTPFRVDRF